MPKYRKKPVEIEAVQWTGANAEEVIGFAYSDDRWKAGIDSPLVDGPSIGYTVPTGELHIPTLEGEMTAKPGDYIIRGIKGELYPCKPDIFAATYEPVAAPVPQEAGTTPAVPVYPGWLPIESAPKDGTSILIRWAYTDAPEQNHYEVGWWSEEYEDWIAGECSREPISNPTLWTPLPPAPEGT